MAILQVESARGCAAAARALEAEILRQAIRRSDLLLVHLVSPLALAQRLSAVEHDEALAERER